LHGLAPARSTRALPPTTRIASAPRRDDLGVANVNVTLKATDRLFWDCSPTKAGCPIQAVLWLEWDTTALDAPFFVIL
jgi:hypothetical protein